MLVYQYFNHLRQKEKKKSAYKTSIYQETACALKVSPWTVKQIVLMKKGPTFTDGENGKSAHCKLDNFDKELIRRTVYDF